MFGGHDYYVGVAVAMASPNFNRPIYSISNGRELREGKGRGGTRARGVAVMDRTGRDGVDGMDGMDGMTWIDCVLQQWQ